MNTCLLYTSTRAAVEEGIICGGGSAYIHASKEVAKLVDTLEGDEKTGGKVILKALEAPLFHIAVNAGLELSLIHIYTIEQEALRDYVPIIRVETQSLLKLLLKQKKPRRILELGTAVGFSALLMCEYAPSDCHVTTIENYEKRIPVAKHNFERAGKCDQITLLEGDAMEIIKTLDGPYDLDVYKRQLY